MNIRGYFKPKRKEMKFQSSLVLLVFLFTSAKYTAGQVIIREVEPIPVGESIVLSSKTDSNYPSVGADVIWKIKEHVDIKIKTFNIDSQIGDFVLLSKFPFPSINGDLSPEKLINLLPLGQGIILTGNLPGEKTFRLIPETAGFLYFHGEYGNRHPESAGFNIELTPFDKTENTAPTSTESSITTPIPNRESFVQKYVTGKEPAVFVKDLGKFKSAIAVITNNYCEQKNIPLSDEAKPSDVKISYDEIRFCDRGWSAFSTCVEVNFAISIYDTSSNYVMTAERIHELWDLYCPELAKDYGYFCYDPPANPESPVAWIWIAISLSVVLIFSLILCMAWIKKASDDLQNDSEIAKAINDEVDEENFYDRKNPIKDVLRTFTHGKSEKDDFVSDLVQQHRSSTLNYLQEDDENNTNHNSTFTYHNQLFESDGFTSTESSESEDDDINEYERNSISRPASLESETSEFRLRRQSPNQNLSEVDTLY